MRLIGLAVVLAVGLTLAPAEAQSPVDPGSATASSPDVGQLLVLELARVGVEQSDLLLPRVQIASDENNEFSLHLCDVVVLGSTEATSSVGLFS